VNTCEDSVFGLQGHSSILGQRLQEGLIRAKTVSARRVNTCEDSVFVCVCVGASQVSLNRPVRLQSVLKDVRINEYRIEKGGHDGVF
ncbi:MAG: hypothetical protein WA125_15780, partial [Desulfosporosinus sp.]